MRFILQRTYEEKGTLGELYFEGVSICRVIERPRTGEHCCIPEGTYTLSRYNSPKHGPNTWLYDNVPAVEGQDGDLVEIHIANWPHELLGCQAPGLLKARSPSGEPGVGYSAVAYNMFMDLTKDLSSIVITIQEAKP